MTLVYTLRSASSRRQSLATGRLNVPCVVWTSTVRMRPSSPGKVLTTRPRFHLPWGKLSSTTSTRSPIWASVWDLVLHFLRSVSVGMYSRNHLLQKSVWACLHRFLEFKSLSSKTSEGTFGLFLPIRKWLGMIASGSWGSMLTWVSGRLLSRL